MQVDRLLNWFEDRLPEILTSFNPPAKSSQLDDLEELIGIQFPDELRALYSRFDGQDRSATTGLFYGCQVLSLKDMESEWRRWFETYNDENMQEFIHHESLSSYREGCVRPMYANPKWLPLSSDGGGNCIGIDYDPGPNGVVGQVINFGRDEHVKYVMGNSFGEFIAWCVDQLDAGNYVISEFSGHSGGKVLNTKFPPTQHFLDAVPVLFK